MIGMVDQRFDSPGETGGDGAGGSEEQKNIFAGAEEIEIKQKPRFDEDSREKGAAKNTCLCLSKEKLGTVVSRNAESDLQERRAGEILKDRYRKRE